MNPVEKRKLDIRNTVALDNFKSNLLSDGTYIVDEDILTKSYRHLPHHMRDADLTMVAGAYKSGSIACYDNNGNIVDLGFSRADQRSYIDDNKNILLANANIPRLDYLTYKSSIFGYLIEQSGYTFHGNTSFYRLPDNGVSNVINGNNTFSQPWTMTENAVNGTSRAIATQALVDQFSGVGVVTISTIFRLNSNDRKIRIEVFAGAIVGSSTIFVNPNDNSFEHGGANPSCFDISIRNYYEDWKILKFSINVNYISNPFVNLRFALMNISNQTTFVGVAVNTFEVVSFTAKYNDTSESPRYGNTVVNTFQQNDEDIVSPITLPYDSIIHIKTAKGIQEFILPAGTFDINDYVVNDKLICFAIKYLPDIEDFINNLTLDGTYTFDENVIRDSWSDLMNRISANSTLLHQFCNSDHIVLPYAYKTGYVAAMDLSDGSIVDIEFERSGSAYGIMDDFILYPTNVPVLDKELTKNKAIGYLIEESVTNRHNGNIQPVDVSVIGNHRDFNTPYTFTNTGPGARLQNINEIGHTYISPYKMQFTYIIKAGETNVNPRVSIRSLLNASQFVDINGIDNDGNIISTHKSGLIPSFDYEIFKIKDKIIINIITSDLTTSNGIQGTALWANNGVWQASVLGDKAELLHFQRNLHYGNYTLGNIHRKILVPNTSCNRDWLKTESYSRIITLGAITGLKVGYNTDPQSLVKNDKINFILLKQ